MEPRVLSVAFKRLFFVFVAGLAAFGPPAFAQDETDNDDQEVNEQEDSANLERGVDIVMRDMRKHRNES